MREKPGQEACPWWNGSPTFFPPTLDAKRMIAYVAGGEGCISSTAVKSPMDEKKDYIGLPPCCTEQGRVTAHGALWAMDLKTGKIVGKATFQPPTESGMLSTDGGVLFTGHMNGKLAAYDADTLQELWSFNLGTPITAPPMTYSVDGKQYIAVVAGGAVGVRAGGLLPAVRDRRGVRPLRSRPVDTTKGERAAPPFFDPTMRRERHATFPARRPPASLLLAAMAAGSGCAGAGAEDLGHQARQPDQGPAGRFRRHRLRHQWRPAGARAQEASRSSRSVRSSARPGLHEVWFRYDDEMEYVARARRSDIMVRQYQANALAGQPIITSLLIDDDGLVQGYRVVNDPRADARTRIAAFGLADLFKGMVLGKVECNDLPPAEGERPIDDLLVKEDLRRQSERARDPRRGAALLQAGPVRRRPQRQPPHRESVRELRPPRGLPAGQGRAGAALAQYRRNARASLRIVSERSVACSGRRRTASPGCGACAGAALALTAWCACRRARTRRR